MLEQKVDLRCTRRIAMVGSGQQLDFEPIREHKPPHGEAERSDNKKEKRRANPPFIIRIVLPKTIKLHKTKKIFSKCLHLLRLGKEFCAFFW